MQIQNIRNDVLIENISEVLKVALQLEILEEVYHNKLYKTIENEFVR